MVLMRAPLVLLLTGLFLFGAVSCVDVKKDKDEDNNQNTILCGNGVVDPGEQCDDGNTVAHDGCDQNCRSESFCGDGIVEGNEECDDGNGVNGDGCDRQCSVESGCGDGVLQVGEECDDDNVKAGDGCDHECRLEGAPVCGNGIHEYTEVCDDGNTTDGDGCSSDCKNENGCGDGVLDEELEQCDDGNGMNGDGCSNLCLVEFSCGNNVCSEEQGETCDLCPQDCCPDCGNGILDEDEGCDDGNNTEGDGCSRGCVDEDSVATCGNGIWEVGEECDDGNLEEHDGCSPTCTMEFECGDNVCESDVGENCQRCSHDCCPACGNGVRQGDEICDGDQLNGRDCTMFGFDSGSLACTSWCEYDFSGCVGTGPVCGNGVKEYGEECDGNDLEGNDCMSLGFEGGFVFCTNNCTYNTSGCSGQLRWFFEDFDTVLPPQGWQFSYPFEWGTPSTVGPDSAFSGSACVGTNIDGNISGDSSFVDTWFRTPAIDLTGATDPVVYFWGWMELDDSTSSWREDDEWKIEYSLDGVNWNPITSVDPAYNSPGADSWFFFDGANTWIPYVAEVHSLAGESQVFFRISAQWDHYGDYAGIYIDNFMVVNGASIPITITSPNNLGNGVVSYPFSREIQVWGGSGDFTYEMLSGGPSWLTLDTTTGVLTGTPTTGDIGSYTFSVQVVDNQNITNTDTKVFNVAVLDAVYFEDFEAGLPADWTISGGIFEHGIPTGTGSPSSAFSGTKCVGTDMNAQYPANMAWGSHCVTTGSIDLTGMTAATLTFKGWRDLESRYDGAVLEVQVNNSGPWSDNSTRVPAYNSTVGGRSAWSGYEEVWEDFEVDLGPHVGNQVRLRWCMRSDSSSQHGGWFFDDVMILGN